MGSPPYQYFHVRVLLNIAGYAGVRFLGIGNGAQKGDKAESPYFRTFGRKWSTPAHIFPANRQPGTYRLQGLMALPPFEGRPLVGKLVVIGLIVLGLMIPLFMLRGLITERSQPNAQCGDRCGRGLGTGA